LQSRCASCCLSRARREARYRYQRQASEYRPEKSRLSDAVRAEYAHDLALFYIHRKAVYDDLLSIMLSVAANGVFYLKQFPASCTLMAYMFKYTHSARAPGARYPVIHSFIHYL